MDDQFAGLSEPELLPEDPDVEQSPQPAEGEAEAAPAKAVEEADPLAELRAENERLAAESRGRLAAITGQREEMRGLKDEVLKLNSRFEKADEAPLPDQSEEPISYLDARNSERSQQIIDRLDKLETGRQQADQVQQVQQAQAAIQQRAVAEIGGDEAVAEDFNARLNHTANAYKNMALGNGATPEQADAAVQQLMFKASIEALQSGGTLYDLVKKHSDGAGYVKAAAVEESTPPPANPALQPGQQTPVVGNRVSLGSLSGNSGSRKLTSAQLDDAGDDVYAELFKNDGEKWREIQKHKFTYL